VPNATGTPGVDLKETGDAGTFTVRQRPCPRLLVWSLGGAIRRRSATPARFPPNRHLPQREL